MIEEIIINIPGGMEPRDLADFIRFLKAAFTMIDEDEKILRMEFHPRRRDR